MLLSRRHIGPAYEVTPAEKTGRWIRDRLLRLVAAVVAVFIFCSTTDWLVVSLLNFLAAEKAYNNEGTPRFSASDPIVIGVQIIGSLILGFFFLYRFKVHAKF